MGRANKGFHFLGIQYDAAQTTVWPNEKECALDSVKVSLHARSIRQSIDKIRRKQADRDLLNKKPAAEHPKRSGRYKSEDVLQGLT